MRVIQWGSQIFFENGIKVIALESVKKDDGRRIREGVEYIIESGDSEQVLVYKASDGKYVGKFKRSRFQEIKDGDK